MGAARPAWPVSRIVATLSLALLSCGEPESARTESLSERVEPPARGRDGDRPEAASDPATARARAARAAEEPVRTGEPAPGSSRTVPTPAPASAGSLSLTAEACTLDGPEIGGEDSFGTIGPVAWASDGALFLLDQDARVRRYTVVPGDACTLAMDTTYGEGGRLALGGGPGAGPRSIAADTAGHLYVSSSTGGTDRLTGAHLDHHCDTRGSVVVSPDGTVGFALFGSGPLRRIAFGEAGCTIEDFAAPELFASLHSSSFVSPTQILVTGERGTASPIRARLHDRNGVPVGPAFGDTTGAVGAPDHFCRVHAAVACAGGLCVLDGNCRELRVFGPAPEHAPAGAIDLARLLGLGYPWVSGLTELREGVAYVTASQARADGGGFDGFVFRLRAD